MNGRTYQNIYSDLISCITDDEILAPTSHAFRNLTSDFERVANCWALLSQYDLLPEVNASVSKKSSEVSEKYKNDGNRAFIQKDDPLALYYYNRALTYAPLGSKEMSLAFANRSAVTFSLGDYSDAVKDIDRALSLVYPVHLKHKLYERKGKALMNLGNFNDAKKAFQEAKHYLEKSNLIEEKAKALRGQLDSLIADCKAGDVVKERKFSTEVMRLVSLTHGPNQYIESASAALDIHHTPLLGRHLVATTDIYPGDVLAVERPYSCITLPGSYFSHCFYCQKRCHSMLPCLQCTMVCFCDETCRERSWVESHSIECPMLKSLLVLNCGKIELLSLRVLLNATKAGKEICDLASSLEDLESFPSPEKKGFSDDVYLSGTYKAVHNLEGNTNLREVSDLFCRSVVTSCIIHIMSMQTNYFNNAFEDHDIDLSFIKLERKYGLDWKKIFAGGLLLKYLQSMASNAHEVSEMRLFPTPEGGKVLSAEVGSAAYPLLSLINHSCDPNVVRHSHFGSTVVLTAIQIIKKGEQIFDNYGYHHATHTREERQSHLSSQYKFTCQCRACIERWPLYADTRIKEPIYINPAMRDEVEASSYDFNVILLNLTIGKSEDVNTTNLLEWLSSLCKHLRLVQENVKRPWKEFSATQEAIKQCLSFLANHYFYRTSIQAIMNAVDKETGVSPF